MNFIDVLLETLIFIQLLLLKIAQKILEFFLFGFPLGQLVLQGI
jgi:hypothetical protein